MKQYAMKSTLDQTKFFLIFSYRSPSQCSNEYSKYFEKIEEIYSRMISENPSVIILNGDLISFSPFIWKDEKTQNQEGCVLSDYN